MATSAQLDALQVARTRKLQWRRRCQEAICSLLILVGGHTYAAALYQQGPRADDEGNALRSNVGSSGLETTQQIADDFTLSETKRIGTATWEGFYFQAAIPAGKTSVLFRVRTYTNLSHSAVSDEYIATTFEQIGTGNYGSPIYRFTATLANAPPVPAGTQVWFSVAETDADTPLDFRWFTKGYDEQGNSAVKNDTNSPWYTGFQGEFVFALYEPANTPPVADAGEDLAAAVGERVQVNGLFSSDAESVAAALQYQWTIESAPSGSTATLENATAAATGIAPDVPGQYILSLVVRDEGGLVSEAAYVSVLAEIDPAFVFERIESGASTYKYGQNKYESSGDTFQSYGLVNGRLYGTRNNYSYSYDYVTHEYDYFSQPTIGWLDATGVDALVSTGDPIPGSDDARFEYFWLYGRSGTDLGFYGYGWTATGEYRGGEFRIGPDGAIATRPVGPFPIAGESGELQSYWHYWGSPDLAIVWGTDGTYTTEERTVSYQCGISNSETCSYTYTQYWSHQGLYVLTGATAVEIVDTTVAVPGEQMRFQSFGHAARDASAGAVAFVGYWFDAAGQWHQGIYKKSSGGVLTKVTDDRDTHLIGGWYGRLALDGDKLYFGGSGYGDSGYGQSAGGSQWWSAYRHSLFSESNGTLTEEVAGGQTWFQRYSSSSNNYQYSYGYVWPDTWNYAVGNGVLAFPAWSHFYSYDSSSSCAPQILDHADAGTGRHS